MHFDHLPAGTPLLKTLTFAVVHFSVAFSVAYLLTGSLGIASLLAMVEPLCNTVAYFFLAGPDTRSGPGALSVS